MINAILKAHRLVTYVYNSMSSGYLNRLERFKLLEYKIVNTFVFLQTFFKQKL